MKKLTVKSNLPDIPHPSKKSPPMLINEISRLFEEKMKQGENSLSQNSTRLIMICLAHRDNVTQYELVKQTHLRPPTVSVALKNLEMQGYVCRVTDSDDMRAVRVLLTDKGKQLHTDTHVRLKSVDTVLMQGISPEEEQILLRLLGRMRDNILNDINSKETTLPE